MNENNTTQQCSLTSKLEKTFIRFRQITSFTTEILEVDWQRCEQPEHVAAFVCVSVEAHWIKFQLFIMQNASMISETSVKVSVDDVKDKKGKSKDAAKKSQEDNPTFSDISVLSDELDASPRRRRAGDSVFIPRKRTLPVRLTQYYDMTRLDKAYYTVTCCW